MHLISHRGNVDGRKPKVENTPLYIQSAHAMGFDVEVDIWFVDNEWYLGHDEPEYKTTKDWIQRNSSYLWCHAKNIDALYYLVIMGARAFYHQTDDVTLTIGKYLWTYPGKRPLTNISIAVLPETTDWTMEELGVCAGLCSDHIDKYKVD